MIVQESTLQQIGFVCLARATSRTSTYLRLYGRLTTDAIDRESAEVVATAAERYLSGNHDGGQTLDSLALQIAVERQREQADLRGDARLARTPIANSLPAERKQLMRPAMPVRPLGLLRRDWWSQRWQEMNRPLAPLRSRAGDEHFG